MSYSPDQLKKALITGISGQDGSYLAELLINKGYFVYGLLRRSSSRNTSRIDSFIDNSSLFLKYGDLTDGSSLARIIEEVQPDEIYNLGAQSDVKLSWDCPEYTADTDGIGTLRILEAIRKLARSKEIRFYQASTSELFGLIQEPIQNETTPFYPRSPYSVAKLYSYWITVNYRESYGLFASNGILFNHESPRRGENFVTRKITIAATRIKEGLQERLYLGNLNAKRDWGHAKDYVEGMWLILQNDKPDDFVLATGVATTIRDFTSRVFAELGIDLIWEGIGLDEKGIDAKTGKVLVAVDEAYFRPVEVNSLIGDSRKAKLTLGWVPKYDLSTLIREMVSEDLKRAQQEKAFKK